MLRIGQVEVTAQNNKYTDGNVAGGVPATRLRAAALNALQEEVAGVVEGAGLALDPDDFGQMLKALKILFAAKTGSLGALAALVGADNKMPYFTGADTAALTELTAFAREILEQNDAAGVLSKLGLGEDTSLPVGIPLPWPLPIPPSGWIACNGGAFSLTANPKLALVFPGGNTPDLRGVFIRGWDNSGIIDPGRDLLSYQQDAMQPIYGTLTIPSEVTGSQAATGALSVNTANAVAVSTAFSQRQVPVYTLDSSRVTKTASETRPKNIALNYIVRAA